MGEVGRANGGGFSLKGRFRELPRGRGWIWGWAGASSSALRRPLPGSSCPGHPGQQGPLLTGAPAPEHLCSPRAGKQRSAPLLPFLQAPYWVLSGGQAGEAELPEVQMLCAL